MTLLLSCMYLAFQLSQVCQSMSRIFGTKNETIADDITVRDNDNVILTKGLFCTNEAMSLLIKFMFNVRLLTQASINFYIFEFFSLNTFYFHHKIPKKKYVCEFR